ncbi:sigma-70 family RNA polymerase sigma factor [Clostridium botulinum]|nr:sigma-70 family RNA polymerase sigma factor [Clostridium botulinum]MBN3356607.1 sigma-70 family RNA polymerase sigma factor [Clostridium botulinum]NFM81069.1 sigma-70 family RNA polymerase sigma factor [Clostridium botulinum]NFP10915.1 sigma-70 family RNA polymerase sigma factor [Clostridium botulinum]NFR29006.1 sigma-70 family RNA polymerase sigma factor [Clostridium botulinum]
MIHIDNYRKTEYMLYNYKQFKVEIKNILLEIEDIENSYRGIGAMQYSDMPKAHNTNSAIEQEVEQKEKRIEHLNRLISKKENIIKRIDNALEALTERERKLIELRYFNKIPNNRVAEKLDLAEQTTSIMNKKIIDKLSTLMFF